MKKTLTTQEKHEMKRKELLWQLAKCDEQINQVIADFSLDLANKDLDLLINQLTKIKQTRNSTMEKLVFMTELQ